jgi:hypothetical protein
VRRYWRSIRSIEEVDGPRGGLVCSRFFRKT